MPLLWSVWLLSDYNQIGWTNDKSTDCHRRIIAQDTFIPDHIAQTEQIVIYAKFNILSFELLQCVKILKMVSIINASLGMYLFSRSAVFLTLFKGGEGVKLMFKKIQIP